MLEGSIRLSEAQLKQFVVEGLAVDGVTAKASDVYLSYDRGGGNQFDPGNGHTASISCTLAGQKVSISKSEAELKELVKKAAQARGYTVRNLGPGFNYDGGDGPRGGACTTATVFIELPDQLKK